MTEHRTSSLTVWLIVVMTVPMAYVLSCGPIILLWKRGYVGGWVAGLYGPLDSACVWCKPLQQARDWYLSLWAPPPIPKDQCQAGAERTTIRRTL